jgi:hypothetical protein
MTWNTQPTVSESNRVAIAASTSQWNYNVIDIDVTELVKSMVNSSNSNYGFCFMLQSETYYRSMTFGSANNTNAAKRPKLVIEYR